MPCTASGKETFPSFVAMDSRFSYYCTASGKETFPSFVAMDSRFSYYSGE
jgi:hypothetical protein